MDTTRKFDSALFAKRYEETARERGYSPRMLLEELGIDASNLSKWRNSISAPTAANVYQAAQALDESIDWLMGLTDEKHPAGEQGAEDETRCVSQSYMKRREWKLTAVNAVLGTLASMSLYEQVIELPESKKLLTAFQYMKGQTAPATEAAEAAQKAAAESVKAHDREAETAQTGTEGDQDDDEDEPEK